MNTNKTREKMKKTLLTIAATIAISTSAFAEDTARVFNYDTGKKETITRSQIAENDLQCIAKISAWRDALFTVGATYKDAHLVDATKKQDKLFLAYPFTIPTKWINAEKELFLVRAGSSDNAWIESELNKCL